MITFIVLVVAGIYAEKRFSPRVSSENSTIYFDYTSKKGARNKTKLFSY